MRFARELDHFLFAKDPSKAACYHQAPSRCRSEDSRTCERCAIYCAPFIQPSYPPGGPVLLADLKNSDVGQGRMGRGSRVGGGRRCPLHFLPHPTLYPTAFLQHSPTLSYPI